jgi:hypothetical protein
MTPPAAAPSRVRLGCAAAVCAAAAVFLAGLGRWGDVETAEQIAALGAAVIALGGAVLCLYRMLPEKPGEPRG